MTWLSSFKYKYTRKFLYQPRKWLFGQPARKLSVDPSNYPPSFKQMPSDWWNGFESFDIQQNFWIKRSYYIVSVVRWWPGMISWYHNIYRHNYGCNGSSIHTRLTFEGLTPKQREETWWDSKEKSPVWNLIVILMSIIWFRWWCWWWGSNCICNTEKNNIEMF